MESFPFANLSFTLPNLFSLHKNGPKVIRNHVRINVRTKGPSIIVMAIHGGRIEPGTSEIANLIAKDDFSFYSFEGVGDKNNLYLRIPSTVFSEPIAMGLARVHRIVVTIHGCKFEEEVVFIGGLHFSLKSKVITELRNAGFPVAEYPLFGGVNVSNICNKGLDKKGLQLEISRGLRRRFFYKPTNCGVPSLHLHSFSNVIRWILRQFV